LKFYGIEGAMTPKMMEKFGRYDAHMISVVIKDENFLDCNVEFDCI